MDLAAEVAVSIQRTLRNVEEQMDAMFDDESLTENERRWMDFGFFFQNCREYLGHVDIGLPRAVVDTARDVSRRLQNLELVFQGAGVKMAARVGRVMATFQTLQSHMSALPGAMP